jgi:hypothetical protein
MAETLNDRRRVSSRFIATKILLGLVVLFLAAALILQFREGVFELNVMLVSGIVFVGLGAFFVYLGRLPVIEYSALQEKLFVTRKGKPEVEEIPLVSIDKLLFSMWGFNPANTSNYSYVIVYRSKENVRCRLRLHPILFRDDISAIIEHTRSLNPSVEVRNWSVGFNELWD